MIFKPSYYENVLMKLFINLIPISEILKYPLQGQKKQYFLWIVTASTITIIWSHSSQSMPLKCWAEKLKN